MALVLVLLAAAAPQAQMPDPRMMHGQAIPAGELPAGTVTVRVVRQTLGNNVPGVQVELHGAGDVRRVTTGAEGRAQFAGLAPGTRVHARAVVDGEPLASSTFDVPAAGGMRTILVAGLDVAPAAPPGGAVQGSRGLHFGNNTRLAVEFQDDTVTVFYLLELVNDTAAPVPLASPLVIEMPPGAIGTSLFEGASPLATVNGPRLTISGPIPPGITEVPVAYRIDRWDERLTVEQAFPLPLDQIALAVQRLPGMGLESAQAPRVREASLRGQAFLIAAGPEVAAGTPVVFTLTGLPHHSRTPLHVALALAALVVAVAVWLVFRPDALSQRASRKAALESTRVEKLKALAALDAAHRQGQIDAATHAARRPALTAELEQIYRELDDEGGVPGGGRGLAA